VKGKWTPLIDEKTYQRVVAELNDPNRMKVTSFEKKHVGSGVYPGSMLRRISFCAQLEAAPSL